MTDAPASIKRGSLGELAMMPGMPSEPTLKKMMAEHPSFPVLKRGKNGVAYELDLVAAHQFVTAIRAAVDSIAMTGNGGINRVGTAILLTLASPDFLTVR